MPHGRQPAQPASNVLDVLKDVQRGCQGRGLVQQLWTTVLSDTEQNCQHLLRGLKAVLAAPEGYDAGCFLKFLGQWSAGLPSSDDHRDAAEDALGFVLEQLALLTACRDDHGRFRVFAMIAAILQHVPATAALPTEILNTLLKRCEAHVKDQDSKVRKLAVVAMSQGRLLSMEQGSLSARPGVQALMELLSVETNESVLVEVIKGIPVDHGNLSTLVQFAADSSARIACAVYKRLVDSADMRALSVQQRVLVLAGLNTRRSSGADAVQQAARQLLRCWFEGDCKSEPCALIQDLLPAHQQYAVAWLEELIQLDIWRPGQWLQDGITQCTSLKHAAAAATASHEGQGLMLAISAPQALVCACACRHVKDESDSVRHAAAASRGAAASAQAANATKQADVLEDYLPDVEGFAALVQWLAAMGPSHYFAAQQVVGIMVEHVNWADGPSRCIARDMVESLIMASSDNTNTDVTAGMSNELQPVDSWEATVMSLVASMHSQAYGPTEAINDILPMIMRVATGSCDGASQQNALQALRYIEQLSAQLLITAKHEMQSSATAELDSGDFVSVSQAIDKLAVVAGTCSLGRQLLLRCRVQLALMLDGEKHLRTAAHHASELLRSQPDHATLQCCVQGLVDLALAWGMPMVEQQLQWTRASQVQRQAISAVADQLEEGLSLGGHSGAGAGGAPAATEEDAADSGRAAASGQGVGTSLVDLLLSSTDELVRCSVGDDGVAAAQPHQAETLLAMAKLLHSQTMLARIGQHENRAMVLQETDAVRLLRQLLVAYYSPATEGYPRLWQLLTCFFQAYATADGTNQRLLAMAMMPSARLALGISLSPPAGRTAALRLLPFMAHLLQQGTDNASDSHAQVAMLILQEIHAAACDRSCLPANAARVKAYLSVLCKVLGYLTMPSDSDTIRQVAHMAQRADGEVRNRGGSMLLAAARKELAAFAAKIQQLQDKAVPPLSDQEVSDLLQVLQQNWDRLPVPDNDGEFSMAPEGSTATGAVSGAARRTAASSTCSTATGRGSKAPRTRRLVTVREGHDYEAPDSDDQDYADQATGSQRSHSSAATSQPPARRSTRRTAAVTNQRIKASSQSVAPIGEVEDDTEVA